MDVTVARGFMPDGTVRGCTDIYMAVSGLEDDNIIGDFIPVLEITSRIRESHAHGDAHSCGVIRHKQGSYGGECWCCQD